MSQNVADLGEFGLIAALTARFPQGSGVLVGPGDDAAVLTTADGRVVVTTDLLIENRHFRRAWSSAVDTGHKAAAQNFADIVAMGAVPTALVVGLGAPPDLPADWALGFADGLREECEPLGASVVGGDVVESGVVVVAATALGDLQGRAPVTRAGARPGDIVAVCGRLGWAEAGFRVLSRGFRSPRILVEAHRRPAVPYAAGPEAAVLGATAMCDVSDGLVADLGHIAATSRVAIELNGAAFEVPDPIRDAAAALGATPLDWILTGGDDNALAATFGADLTLPDSWRVVGSVSAGNGVTVDGAPFAGEPGHTHFS
ncbi:MAG TPA: thiamine-phosphate kinase [Jiangellaceae bacterium]|jgi:thiamine-monophosphate kinase|nr:thiamine-phosphate kinase [Jiangellaceae bacterium]